MKKIIFLLFVIQTICTNSQEYYDTIMWLKVNQSSAFATNNHNNFTKNDALNQTLIHYKVKSYKQAVPFAKNPELLKIHELTCDCKIDSLISELERNHTNVVKDFSRFYINDTVTYDPADYMWYLGWLWHLNKIQANLAWDITHGNPNIKIAVIDYDVDISHPDLASKIVPLYDPYTNIAFDCSPYNGHGTCVASFAGAETTEQGNIANGQLASAGFNTKIIFYNSPSSAQQFLARALHASNIMNARVIVSCAGGSLCCSPAATGEADFVKEILDNGTVIIAPAGNGYSGGAHCGSGPNSYTPFYPFNPIYDERIIVVTSSDENDNHQLIMVL
ncbi:MAG: S8 family serine peptidase [Bacteroidia bacterium]|nr:S8 family serine peptidase [Bacteroidia bacterium]